MNLFLIVKKNIKKFLDKHSENNVKKGDFNQYNGKLFLGIDAGSTTTKAAVIDEDGRLLYSFLTEKKIWKSEPAGIWVYRKPDHELLCDA